MNEAKTANEVYAVKFATAETARSQNYLRYHVYGVRDQAMTSDFFYWAVKTPTETILFDSGFTEDVATKRDKQHLMPVENGLTALGVTPTDISTIIISHMHYDHVGNLELFPNANLIVQQWEWDFWTGPMAARAQFAQLTVPAYVENLLAAHSEKRIHTISGDVEVATGISTLLLTGHTPGQQGLLIETPENTICLASDAAHFYDELRNDWPFCIVSDLLGMYKTLDRLRALEDDDVVIVPGHDSAVGRLYPSTDILGGGSLVRLG